MMRLNGLNALLPAVVGAVLITLMLIAVTAVPSARAAFGLKDQDVTFTNADGSPMMQAGSHPFAWTTTLDFKTGIDPKSGKEVPEGEAKDLRITFPPGLVGTPDPVPVCSSADFFKNLPDNEAACPDSTVVGVIRLSIGFEESGFKTLPVYNLEAAPGKATKLGFVALGVRLTIDVGVSQVPPYNLVATPTNIPDVLRFYGSKLTVWGNPASPAHDSERGECAHDTEHTELCPVNIPEKAFFTLPRSCTGPLTTVFETDSWADPGNYLQTVAETHDNAEPGNPLGLTGCSKLAFSPTITARPTTLAAQSPTGLDFSLNFADEGLANPTGIAQSDIKKAVVTLPEGMTANPSLAEGLSVCSEAGLASETIDSSPGEGCPSESKIGTVEVETPLLGESLKGSLFIAEPHRNPFGSLLALYFVIKDPTLGILIKQPAEIEPDSQTGRIVTIVEGIPQLPFSHFKLHFREGARSPLVSPPACGTYNASAELTPYSGGAPIVTTSAFQIISGPGGNACPAGGVPPFTPQATSGTLNNNAGNYSPFYLRLTRTDGEQELTKFTTNFPPGLTGNLSGIPFCPDAAIEAARAVRGAQETSQPSCPAASEIGHTLVGAGVGGVLAWAPGKVYLAGPYHGSALSVVSITSATVGPFDLGTVVIRFALRINPITAQVEIDSTGSDPIPHIIDGIVVHVREIHVYVDREKFIRNPTSCNPLSISNTITGAGADIANPADDTPVTLSSRFQASDCSSLGFKPSFKVSTSGKTSRANGASLSVKLAYPKAPDGSQANIRSVKVDLPKQLPSRLTTLQKACTNAQFEANPAGCPAASIVGHATAITPILPVPLAGPAYFVSHGGAKFPELIVVLQGYGVTIDLHGETFISKTGITSSTFHAVPDQPVTSFELTLPQGKYSALAANGNLCKAKLTMPTMFTAQNGVVIKQNTTIDATGCPRHKSKKAKKQTNDKKTEKSTGKRSGRS